VPFGGYVKIAGMVDESMDKEQLKAPPQPYEFRSKPAWQRLIIMLGGVTVNVILALLIFIFITWVWGERFIPIQNVKYGVYSDTLGQKIGVQDGDKIIAVNGKPVERVGTVGSEIIMNEAKHITVERGGKQFQIPIPGGFVSQLNANRLEGFTYIRIPLVVDTVTKDAKISNGIIQKGDRLIAFNDTPVLYNTDLRTLSNYKDKKAVLTLLRNNGDTAKVEVLFDKSGKSGIGYKGADQILGTREIRYSFAEAVPAGVRRCFETLTKYVQNLAQLFTSKEVKVRDSLGSVLSIGGVFPGVWDWQSFWTLTAIFSIILAFMNVLPIPALDGGHALFTLYEMITGRKPSDKFMEYAQMVGMVLLLGLMLYAFGLDIWRLFK
jgi:regulator of sigma E protease